MKTAISIPDATFERVDKRAKALGVSRSEFYFRAVELYLDRLEEEDLTERINEALERGGQEAEDEAREFAEFGLAQMARHTADDEW